MLILGQEIRTVSTGTKWPIHALGKDILWLDIDDTAEHMVWTLGSVYFPLLLLMKTCCWPHCSIAPDRGSGEASDICWSVSTESSPTLKILPSRI